MLPASMPVSRPPRHRTSDLDLETHTKGNAMAISDFQIPLILPKHRAIVTGAARGIGRTIATTLGQAGAAILVADIDVEGAERTAAELRQRELRATALQVDVSDPASVKAMVAAAISDMDGIDI